MNASVPGQLIPRGFFDRAPQLVAPALLGKLLFRPGNTPLVARVVETEAYLGNGDPAAHAFRGKTPRNEALFGPPGHAYVYLIYGMHFCLNVSCEPAGQAGCVLIRAVEPVSGVAQMAAARDLPPDIPPRNLTGGPARLCQAFGITREQYNGTDMTQQHSPLQWRDDGFRCETIETSPRVGIRKAIELPLRFHLSGHHCISR